MSALRRLFTDSDLFAEVAAGLNWAMNGLADAYSIILPCCRRALRQASHPLNHAVAELLRTVTAHKKKGRLRCRERPKSREATPMRAAIAGWGSGGYRIRLAKTIAIGGSR
jgi:hypothetical protein